MFFKKQKKEEKSGFGKAAGKDATYHYLIPYLYFHIGL